MRKKTNVPTKLHELVKIARADAYKALESGIQVDMYSWVTYNYSTGEVCTACLGGCYLLQSHPQLVQANQRTISSIDNLKKLVPKDVSDAMEALDAIRKGMPKSAVAAFYGYGPLAETVPFVFPQRLHYVAYEDDAAGFMAYLSRVIRYFKELDL